MEGAAERFRIAGERDIALAHTTALFTRVKKLEPLSRYLPDRPHPAAPGTMLDRLTRLAAATEKLG